MNSVNHPPRALPALAEPRAPERTQTEQAPGSAILLQRRLIQAPRALVWQAFTDPLQLGQWWGPKGFSLSTRLFEFRPGGRWVFTMHGPDPDPHAARPGGPKDFPCVIVFDAIEQPDGGAPWRIAYHHESADGRTPMHFHSEVLLALAGTAEAPATQLSLSAEFASEASRDAIAQAAGAAQGGRETLARLAHHTEGPGLAETRSALGHRLVLSRELPVPRALVWRCWTEPELMRQWYCPQPWAVVEVDQDLRPGGRANNVMAGPGPDGQPMRVHNVGSYLEVVPGERLTFTNLLLEDWTPAPAPLQPMGFTATVLFEDAGEGRCRYTAICRHVDEASQAQHAAMGFHAGWGTAGDQLLALAQRLAAA